MTWLQQTGNAAFLLIWPLMVPGDAQSNYQLLSALSGGTMKAGPALTGLLGLAVAYFLSFLKRGKEVPA